MIPLSILDLSPINEGQTISQAFKNTVRLAQTGEEYGYNRIWLAEHHGMNAVASAATSLLISHVGHHTKTIRIGSGGIMLPNHSPLVIAEQFGTLATFFPGRVDLGLGRAPGTDTATARALRRSSNAEINRYPEEVKQLQHYFDDQQGDEPVIAIPGVGTKVPLWMLGSSLYSAQLAAQLGLPYSFASHFAPDQLVDAITIYRQLFQPSSQLEKPYVMAGVMAVIAETDGEAEHLFTSVQQQFVNLRRGLNKPSPKPVKNLHGMWTPMEKTAVDHSLRYALVGSPTTVANKMSQLIEKTQADELILSFPIYDIEARLNAVKLVSQIFRD